MSNLKVGNLQRKEILDLLVFEFYEPNVKFESFLFKLCDIDLDPKFLYEKLHSFFIINKIVIPKYYVFQLLIKDVIKNYENKLNKLISSLITKDDEKKIEEILQLKDDRGYISKLAFIRTSSKGFNKSYVQEEIEKRKHLEKLFPRAKIMLN